jgi:hypothetical protein
MTLAIQVTGIGLTSDERTVTTPPETFGSKFRAITRAITHGQSGVITVNRGRSQGRKQIPWKHKLAGHGLMTCGFGGGQGRGRTADLPIFSRSFGDRRQGPALSGLLPLVGVNRSSNLDFRQR